VKENCSIVGKKDPQNERRVNYDYKFGPEMEGHSENTHIKFVSDYLQSASEEPFPEHIESLKRSNERNDEVRRLQNHEAFTIQIEMLIYLKIWEATPL
jgi:hypothetical protein